MLTVDRYGDLRRAHRDGLSRREIARTFGHSRRKIREILANPLPKTYTRTKPTPAPVLGAFHAAIDAILADDEQAPPKQPHTAMQLYRRLRDEHGYTGGYDQVRRYVGKHQRDRRETFIPLAHDPGQRPECDFGHIHVDFADGRRPVAVFVSAWAYSNYPFVPALPSERTEAIPAGMVEAFAFFGCVPHEVWWDNPTTVVSRIFQGRERRPNTPYAGLASHYTFDPLFCMPARGHEESYAGNRVEVVQRQWATPVPRTAHPAALSAYFRDCCAAEVGRSVAGKDEAIGPRFARDRAAALPLPRHPFDACVAQPAVADEYQTARFDRNRYSVPRGCAFRTATVKGYVERVEVVGGGQVVARHARCYGHNEQVLDPRHYLATLGRRPAALGHAPVLRNWQLPESFTRLRRASEQRRGAAAGARHYVRVLQLLAEYPPGRVREAVEACLRRDELHAERIAAEARRRTPADDAPSMVTPLCHYQVPRPDLGRLGRLLNQGDSEDA